MTILIILLDMSLMVKTMTSLLARQKVLDLKEIVTRQTTDFVFSLKCTILPSYSKVYESWCFWDTSNLAFTEDFLESSRFKALSSVIFSQMKASLQKPAYWWIPNIC